MIRFWGQFGSVSLFEKGLKLPKTKNPWSNILGLRLSSVQAELIKANNSHNRGQPNRKEHYNYYNWPLFPFINVQICRRRMPGAAQEREASADSRAKAFKNKGKDNEVSISP